MNFRLDRFEQLQTRQGLNNNQLEKKAGLGQGTVTRWKNGSRTPSADTLSKVSKVLGCDIEYLWGLTDTPTAEIERAFTEYSEYFGIELTSEEKLLLEKFRKASTEGKFKIIQTAMNEETE